MKLAQRRLAASRIDRPILPPRWAHSTSIMQGTELSQDTQGVNDGSRKDHDMHNLMAGAKDIDGSRKPLLRKLGSD